MVPFCIIPFGFMQDGAKQVFFWGGVTSGSCETSETQTGTQHSMEDWVIGGLEDWRIGGLEDGKFTIKITQSQITQSSNGYQLGSLVGAEGLEPSLLSELEPKSSVSAVSPRALKKTQTDGSEDGLAGLSQKGHAPSYFASAALASAAGASSLSLISSTQTHCSSTIFAASPLRVNSLRMRV